ncbi:MAG: NAD(P)/FAD-dependent oxidoreductase [Desulfobacterales bacterium]|nr:NAD(P)/FAD-dependent oxidoreductase [Desulfobacterales bacterium]MDJ0888759.1 NAD(P)/FAD-dependent oxidoreductase [Desulfobacterales bacterium]MDJ0990784.1 NAD(P)/FAD-dependent oxidoreductase [Desulfobacterales bacterium]
MLKLGEKGTILQRDKQTYAIAPHIPCGMTTPAQLRTIADVAEKYDCQALKLTSAARIAIIGLREEDIDQIWADLGMVPGHAVGLCVRSIKVCPGTDYCRLGLQDSLAMGMRLDDRFHGMELPNKMKMGVSGCTNNCAENCIKDIALMGKKKGWTVTAGGNGAKKPRLADHMAEELDDDAALAMIDRIIDYYRENGKKGERIGQMIDRLGLETFRQAVHPA